MKIVHLEKSSKHILEDAIEVLKKGGLIVAPSDTVYGLLVDATNEEAVKKLISFKNRPLGKSISVFVNDIKNAEEFVQMNDKQKKTLEKLLPGPFTIVLPSFHKTSALLESEKGTLGIRIPSYNFINDLIKEFGKPTTATSANLGGRSPHYSVGSLLNQLPQSKKEMIDLIIDAGKLPNNKPSTVIDLTTPELKIIRQGDIVFNSSNTYQSRSPSQTKKLAQHIFKKTYVQDKPVIYILQGDLGVGKTVFVKGIAEQLGIKNIISPTFTIYYEYDLPGNKKLIHVDLYNIQESEEFKHLGLESYLQPGNIFFIEWGEKAAQILPELKKRAKIIYMKLSYLDDNFRQITFSSHASRSED